MVYPNATASSDYFQIVVEARSSSSSSAHVKSNEGMTEKRVDEEKEKEEEEKKRDVEATQTCLYFISALPNPPAMQVVSAIPNYQFLAKIIFSSSSSSLSSSSMEKEGTGMDIINRAYFVASRPGSYDSLLRAFPLQVNQLLSLNQIGKDSPNAHVLNNGGNSSKLICIAYGFDSYQQMTIVGGKYLAATGSSQQRSIACDLTLENANATVPPLPLFLTIILFIQSFFLILFFSPHFSSSHLYLHPLSRGVYRRFLDIHLACPR